MKLSLNSADSSPPRQRLKPIFVRSLSLSPDDGHDESFLLGPNINKTNSTNFRFVRFENMDMSIQQILQNFLREQSTESNFEPELPKRHSIRFSSENQVDQREKFDGTKWRPVCNAPGQICSNFAKTHGLCVKHRNPNDGRRSLKRKLAEIGE